ncbi:MAG: hypothetical protein WCI97_05805, partial [Bacteroidota bacterium]
MNKLFTFFKTTVALSVLLFISGQASAQLVAAYTFAQSAGVYTPIVGTLVASGANDDNSYGTFPIGANFTYHGTVYTTWGCTDNGFMTLGAVSPLSYGFGSVAANSIGCMSRDLQGQAAGSIRYQYTAPVLTVQWTEYRY